MRSSGVREFLLGIAQPTVSERQVAVLYAERDFPQVVGSIAQHVVVPGELHARACRFQEQEVRWIRDRLLRIKRQRIVEINRARQLVGVKCEDLPLFGDRSGERFEEPAGRQNDLLRHASPS